MFKVCYQYRDSGHITRWFHSRENAIRHANKQPKYTGVVVFDENGKHIYTTI